MLVLYENLVYTILIELPVAIWLFRYQYKNAILFCILINLFTWPLLHFLLLYFDINIFLLEGAVVILEAAVYRIFFPEKRILYCSIVSSIANGASFGMGLLIQHFS